MKVTFIFNEMPYPPNHGGRVDVWRRIKAFKRAGIGIQFICWVGDQPRSQPMPAHLDELRNYVDEIHLFTIGSDLISRILRLIRLTKYSSHVASRILNRAAAATLLSAVGSYRPDAVWLDAIYGGEIAISISEHLGIPLYVRSHNIEHRYMKGQALLARSLRDRLMWGLAVFHLKKYETSLLQRSKYFFDCSYDDLLFWEGQGLGNGYYLPQTIDPETDLLASPASPWTSRQFDVVFMGNLHSPNNVQGLLWFITEVLPFVIASRPDVTVLIAGSHPAQVIRDACAQRPNVTLVANPESSADVYRAGKVLVNPVLAGSGVMVKSIEMLFFDAVLVSTPQGVYGVPPEAKACFAVRDEPEGFGAAIVDALTNQGNETLVARRAVRKIFGDESLIPVINLISTNT